MSEIIDTCEEQYLSIQQLLRLVLREDTDGSLYINICDSGLNPNDLHQQGCYQFPNISIFNQVIGEDSSGFPCLKICSTDNLSVCNNRLDFEHICNSQYLTLI